MKRSILFVDDERSVLQGLQRSLRSLRNEWSMMFAESGRDALRLLDEQSFDAIVTDMRMPEMSGAELLEVVMEKHPGVIRIILSGHSGDEMIARSVNAAHQFLIKPCDAATIKDTLSCAFKLKALLESGRLQSFVTGLRSLPSLPSAYITIIDKLHSQDASLRDIGEIISSDPAMTAKILKLVNSAFFGLGRRVSDTREAAAIIGLDALKALALSVGIFSQFDPELAEGNSFSIEALFDHSLAVAKLSERIAQLQGAEKSVVDDCFLAGVVHDIGVLILEQNFSADYLRVKELVRDQGLSLHQAEQEVFGTTHGVIGAYLLGLWKLPNQVVEAVAFHQQPELSPSTQFSPLVAVHVADSLMQRHGEAGSVASLADDGLNLEFLTKIGVADRIEAWKGLLSEGGLA